MPGDSCGARPSRLSRVVDHPGDRPGELPARQMLRDGIAHSEDARSWLSDKVQLLHEKPIPSVVARAPVDAGALDQHRALRQVSDVVVLRWLTQVLPDAEMQDEVLDRGDEVPEPGLDSCLRLVWGASSPAEGRFHADEYVLHRPQR